MKKSIGLLFCIISCSSIWAEEKEIVPGSLRKTVKTGMAAAIGICLAYEGYKWYTSPSEEVSQEQVSDGQNTIKEKKPITLNDRIEYFGIGAGYSLLTVASILATYKCAMLSLDKMYRFNADPVKQLHNFYDRMGYPKSGDEWEEDLAEERDRKRGFLLGSPFIGSLAIAIPYLAYYRYKFPHAAVENLKKAFQR